MTFDWFTWAMGLVQGTITAIIGGIVIFYFLIPKMTDKLIHRAVAEVKKDPEIRPAIDKTKEIMEKLKPVMEKFGNLDLDKLQRDFQPLYDAIRQINPEEMEGLMRGIKDLTGTVKVALDKPKEIPKPQD